MPSSRIAAGRYPAPGTSEIADRIRERRGARGLTPLDAALLHVPPVANGWNSLLGAIRSQGKLPGDIRELMILRVAAINRAAFEWIQHEIVGRSCGLTTQQLAVIRNTSSLTSSAGVLTALQSAALVYAEESTKNVQIPSPVTDAIKKELASLVLKESSESSNEELVQDLLVETAAVVATYNMVSRFLVSLDVAGLADAAVPWPSDRTDYTIPLSDHPDSHFHAVTHVTNPSAPWLVFCNSLLTDTMMWSHLLPFILDQSQSSFNVLLHDQRGHGLSSSPSPCTIPILAQDIATILDHLEIAKVLSVIGVSQGGATALSFAAQFPKRTASVIAADTGPRTAPGNKEAWQDRIRLAQEKGITSLANVTASRWFPNGSKCYPGTNDSGISQSTGGARYNRTEDVIAGIESTSIEGFELGAGALMDYDLISGTEPSIVKCTVPTLLVAGSLDGDGKVAKGMRKLQGDWNETLGTQGNVQFSEIEGSGHLPMIDETEKFWAAIEPFLRGLSR